MTQQDQFLYLTTTGWKTGRKHTIEIWFVERQGRYYVMSEDGERAHWVQNITREPEVSFSAGKSNFAGTGRAIQQDKEPELAAEIRNLMKRKYGWDQGLIVELVPALELA